MLYRPIFYMTQGFAHRERQMNFDKYAKALAEHTDKSIEDLSKSQAGHKMPEPRPSSRVRHTEEYQDTYSVSQSHKTQSSLFPGSDPKLARWED